VDQGLVAGIDLGGTQVRVALADTSGRIVASTKTMTPSLRGPRGFVDWAADSIERIGGGAEVQSVAVGVPGPVDQRKGVLVNPPNLHGWQNVPLVEMLETAVGAPVYLENDANLAGLGESTTVRVGERARWST
jgi:glucokinase